jgi:hypothetical protein
MQVGARRISAALSLAPVGRLVPERPVAKHYRIAMYEIQYGDGHSPGYQ